MPGLTSLIAEHRFAELFREELGWDRASGTMSVDLDERRLTFDAVAQKRGFQVLQCNVDRRVLFNRGLLRRAQTRVARGIHEHILIYSCDRPLKQVWQWAARTEDGRRLRHREHPFFSVSPPEPLIERLVGLRFSLADEERGPTLIDALDRARIALDAPSELNLFAKNPKYAEQSDALAVAMRNGDESAFTRFIELHRPLARYLAKWPQQSYRLSPEDAEQIATIGLIKAARGFDPDRGYQFSTYAYGCILQTCCRLGLKEALLIRLPDSVLVPILPIWRRLENSRTARRPDRPRHEIARVCALRPSPGRDDKRIDRAMSVRSLSDPDEHDEATTLPSDSTEDALESIILQERMERIQAAIGRLRERPRRILRMRYGIGCDPRTLTEVGTTFGITRERVRQIQVDAERSLRTLIQADLKDLLPER